MAPENKIEKRAESEITRREQHLEYYLPAVDICETDNEFIVKFDMPGVDKEKVEITAEKNMLTVVGYVSMESVGNIVYQETRIGNYRREFTLPEDVDADSISAEMKDGVLTVKIAKPEKVKPKKIEIACA